MNIVICHLTRMRSPYICIAGIDPGSGNHVRPVLRQGQLHCDLLDCKGGCINIGKLLEIGPTRAVGQKPELEDRLFNPGNLSVLSTLKPHEFWGMLLLHSRDNLTEIFGDDLAARDRSYVIRKGTGNASLGILLPKKPPTVSISEFRGKKSIRIGLFEKNLTSSLSLTDLRFYGSDMETPLSKTVENVSRRLRSGVRAILGVGLTRLWRKPDENEEFHWLQVNNIHMEDEPTWRVEYGN